MKKYVLIVSLIIFSAPNLALAHGGAKGIVKERMDLMENLKQAMKALKPMMRGKETYAIDKVKQNALLIRDNAGTHMTKLFPEGSLHKPSEAKSEIWEEWDNFQKISKRLERLGQALHDGAANEHPKGTMGGKGHHAMMGNDGSKKGEHMQGGHMMSKQHMLGSSHMMNQ